MLKSHNDPLQDIVRQLVASSDLFALLFHIFLQLRHEHTNDQLQDDKIGNDEKQAEKHSRKHVVVFTAHSTG